MVQAGGALAGGALAGGILVQASRPASAAPSISRPASASFGQEEMCLREPVLKDDKPRRKTFPEAVMSLCLRLSQSMKLESVMLEVNLGKPFS